MCCMHLCSPDYTIGQRGKKVEREKERVLWAQADYSILRSFERILEIEGYSVDTAETCTEATGKFRAASFDWGLLDAQRPYTERTD